MEKETDLHALSDSSTFLDGRRPKTLGDSGRTIVIYSTRQDVRAALFKWLF
jgi:hypothetical protein